PFLVLDENRLALAAVERLKLSRARKTPPLVFLHGPSGCGKSHLARMLLREVRRAKPDVRFALLTASEFAARFAEASATETVPDFQQAYRELDLFLCEDLTALEGRPETQQQFVAVLDELRVHGARCLLTSRKMPGELERVSPRLVNRLHGGECVGVRLPGAASRVRLLRHFASTRQVPLSADAMERLADALPVSPRELLAALLQLQERARLNGGAIDAKTVRRFLQAEALPEAVRLRDVARAVGREFRVTLAALRSAERSQSLVLPRQCGMYLSRELTSEPLAAIAAYFGRRNHGTVLHACRRLERGLAHDAALRQTLARIRAALRVEEPRE
ncbi:MAG: DnaA ATPase domain-containing protein, partial [Planctomycetaceae bacterium]